MSRIGAARMLRSIFFAAGPEFRGLRRLQALLRCAMLRAYRQERPLHG
ncbi:hypothetical protein QSH18_11775 [Xanthomonas sp. NCPPB 2654]|nr:MULTISPECIES: hypothetical protein [unclassified Xanthomonas]MDL5366286.1 hypothetical protein [Xanthomonas sp. NCPPB 2654]UYC19086.1 hypothetical protein NUG20_12865 [Xanthomonas sp. CFBP 8443]